MSDCKIIRQNDGSIRTYLYKKSAHTAQYLQYCPVHCAAHPSPSKFYHQSLLSSRLIKCKSGSGWILIRWSSQSEEKKETTKNNYLSESIKESHHQQQQQLCFTPLLLPRNRLTVQVLCENCANDNTKNAMGRKWDGSLTGARNTPSYLTNRKFGLINQTIISKQSDPITNDSNCSATHDLLPYLSEYLAT